MRWNNEWEKIVWAKRENPTRPIEQAEFLSLWALWNPTQGVCWAFFYMYTTFSGNVSVFTYNIWQSDGSERLWSFLAHTQQYSDGNKFNSCDIWEDRPGTLLRRNAERRAQNGHGGRKQQQKKNCCWKQKLFIHTQDDGKKREAQRKLFRLFHRRKYFFSPSNTFCASPHAVCCVPLMPMKKYATDWREEFLRVGPFIDLKGFQNSFFFCFSPATHDVYWEIMMWLEELRSSSKKEEKKASQVWDCDVCVYMAQLHKSHRIDSKTLSLFSFHISHSHPPFDEPENKRMKRNFFHFMLLLFRSSIIRIILICPPNLVGMKLS